MCTGRAYEVGVISFVKATHELYEAVSQFVASWVCLEAINIVNVRDCGLVIFVRPIYCSSTHTT